MLDYIMLVFFNTVNLNEGLTISLAVNGLKEVKYYFQVPFRKMMHGIKFLPLTPDICSFVIFPT